MKKVIILSLFYSFFNPLKAQHLAPPPLRISHPVRQAPPQYIGKKVVYHLYVTDTIVNFSGKSRRAIAVNGQIPMPTLSFTEGDTAEIYVHNGINEETSLHWHGLLLPNQYDGVPYLTTAPIKTGETHLYTFPIIQSGTYWYHSHAKLQEQIGMYGSFVIYKKPNDPTFREADKIRDYPVLLSDWTDEKPFEVHRKLHNATDWYAIQKGATQSFSEAVKEGYLKVKLKNEWKRMTAMDVSDVFYDKFLINGTNQKEAPQFKAGEKVRLRVANGSASTYFWVKYAGGKITVVGSDGIDTEPVEVDRLIIGVSEIYDLVVTIPEDNTSYEFLSTSEDRTKSASLWLGSGTKKAAGAMPRLKYFEGMKMMNGMMKMNGDLDDMGMRMSLNQMDMNVVMYPEITGVPPPPGGGESDKGHDMTNMDKMSQNGDNRYNANALSDIVTLNYSMLKSPTKTTLPKDTPVRELKFELTGNMNRYLWALNNKTISESDKILIKAGENVRIIIYNGSMMRHPMHLHGHFFRVLNGQGDYAPLKNVLDIMPMETDTLEFAANEKSGGDWFFHCHILYHMMSGMGRIFRYENSPPNPELPDKKWADKQVYKEDKEYHFMAGNDFATNGNDGMAMLQNKRWGIGTEWRLGYHDKHGYEVETHIGRYIGKMQWLMPFIGFDWRYRKLGIDEQEKNLFGRTNTKDNRRLFSVGVDYTLPMLVVFQAEVYHDGNVRLQLMREDIPISKRLRGSFMYNTDKEYMVGTRYIFTKYISAAAHYDSDMGFGVGLTVNY